LEIILTAFPQQKCHEDDIFQGRCKMKNF